MPILDGPTKFSEHNSDGGFFVGGLFVGVFLTIIGSVLISGANQTSGIQGLERFSQGHIVWNENDNLEVKWFKTDGSSQTPNCTVQIVFGQLQREFINVQMKPDDCEKLRNLDVSLYKYPMTK